MGGLRGARALLKVLDAWSAACNASGLLLAAFAAGPDEIRGSGPVNRTRFRGATHVIMGVPMSSIDRRVITSISADAIRCRPLLREEDGYPDLSCSDRPRRASASPPNAAWAEEY